MKRANLGDVDITYIDEGDGEAVLLIHGFASNAVVNWLGPGWVKTLTEAGYRAIALDNRGHGGSTKFYQPEHYEPDLMAADALALLNHLAVPQAHVIGYSMGSRIMTFMSLAAPDRLRRLVYGGMGRNLITGVGGWQPIAAALEADDVSQISDPTGLRFRLFADQTDSDRRALAACIRPSRQKITAEAIATIAHPALVAVGTEDDVAGSGAALAAMLPDGRHLPLAGRDHMKAVGDKQFKQGVLAFFAEEKSA